MLSVINHIFYLQCTGSSTDYSGSDITARMLCASASGKDACQGDSGGDEERLAERVEH